VIMDSLPRISTFHQDIDSETAVEIHSHAQANISSVGQPPGLPIVSEPPQSSLHTLDPMPPPPHPSFMQSVYSRRQSPYPQYASPTSFPPPKPVTHPFYDPRNASVSHTGPDTPASGRSHAYRINRPNPPNSGAHKPEFMRKKVVAKEAEMSNLSAIPQDGSDAAMSSETGGIAVVPDTSVSIEMSEQPEPEQPELFLYRHAQTFDSSDDDFELEPNWDTAASFVRTISADGTRKIESIFRSELGGAD
jgi:hypothetical protein